MQIEAGRTSESPEVVTETGIGISHPGSSLGGAGGVNHGAIFLPQEVELKRCDPAPTETLPKSIR